MMYFRRMIVHIGKRLPFIICVVLLINFVESLYAYANKLYGVTIDNTSILFTPLSWFIGKYLTYDWLHLLMMYALSFGLETCWKNKFALIYLTYALIQKHIVENIAIDETIIPIYLALNIAVILAILYLGAIQGIKNIAKRIYN